MSILKSAHGASAWKVGKGRMMGGGGGCVGGCVCGGGGYGTNTRLGDVRCVVVPGADQVGSSAHGVGPECQDKGV